jgi:hypothetical protein
MDAVLSSGKNKATAARRKACRKLGLAIGLRGQAPKKRRPKKRRAA